MAFVQEKGRGADAPHAAVEISDLNKFKFVFTEIAAHCCRGHVDPGSGAVRPLTGIAAWQPAISAEDLEVAILKEQAIARMMVSRRTSTTACRP